MKRSTDMSALDRLVHTLRSLDPSLAVGDGPDVPTGDALFQSVVQTPRPLLRSRHARRRGLLALSGAAIFLALVLPALAVSTSLFHSIGNQPTPRDVQRVFGSSSQGLVQLTTSTGDTATLYKANTRMGDCLYVRIAMTPLLSAKPQLGVAQCSPDGDAARAISRYQQTWLRSNGRAIELAAGKVTPDVATVEIVFKDGGSVDTPVTLGYFLYELSDSATSVNARDSAGAIVDRRPVENVRPPEGK
jgi:hypothetical protein